MKRDAKREPQDRGLFVCLTTPRSSSTAAKPTPAFLLFIIICPRTDINIILYFKRIVNIPYMTILIGIKKEILVILPSEKCFFRSKNKIYKQDIH
jgi:hypothetical protein